jgi:glycosyltransferase involved in cell wall biosynthesis
MSRTGGDTDLHDHLGPLRVCFISPLGYGLYNSESGKSFGGAEVQFFLLANALASDPAYVISVLTTVAHQPGVETHGGLTLFKRLGQGRLELKSGRDILNPVRLVGGYISAFWDMWQQFRRIDADVYLHAGAGVEVGAYALICRLLRKRFLFFIASSADLWEPYGKIQGPLKWLFPLGIRLAEAVVCRSDEQRQRLSEKYGREGVLIRTGHPRPTFHNEPKTSILWVGRGVPLKQPEMFLDLVERLSSHRCVMVVTAEVGQESLLQYIRNRAQVMPNLELHEQVPLHEIEQHFARARVFVNTSTYEGFPNTFVQAAMNGVPVVSWRVDPDRLLSHDTIGLCAGGSFDRLLGLVEELCASQEKREMLGRRAQQYAYAHHDINQSTAALKAYITFRVGQALSRA